MSDRASVPMKQANPAGNRSLGNGRAIRLNPPAETGGAAMKIFAIAMAVSLPALSALAAEPDGLTLPPGFHAAIVADGLGNQVRHMAFAGPSRLYVSTERQTKDAPNAGIIALHLNARHVADQTDHFSTIDDGTAIAFDKGALYASSPSAIYRIPLSANALTPSAPPE